MIAKIDAFSYLSPDFKFSLYLNEGIPKCLKFTEALNTRTLTEQVGDIFQAAFSKIFPLQYLNRGIAKMHFFDD